MTLSHAQKTLFNSSFPLFLILFFLFALVPTSKAQSHIFTFSPGAITSGTAGVSTALNTAGVSGNYLVYVVTADYVGIGGAPASSNTMNLELTNGGATIYKEASFANSGTLNNPGSTTLTWTGTLNSIYVGGGNLTARFFDDYFTGGAFTSSVTNVSITIYELANPHTFATFSPGTVTSGTSGVSTALNTAGLTASYLFYVVTADFVGSGGSPASSNTMNLGFSDGGFIPYKAISHADEGAMNNPNSTTLTWTGTMDIPYSGGGNLTAQFFDDFNVGGPFTSNVTNVSITIYEIPPSHSFTTFSPGNVISGTTGLSTALSVGGLSGDFLFYVVTANYIGVGGSPSFSSNMELELTDRGATVYKQASSASSGSSGSPNPTLLVWYGALDQLYTGGGSLTARFFDQFNTGGPFTSNISNVNITLVQAINGIFPVELLSFEAELNHHKQLVNLSWSTASELNNDYFTVERSKDGETWETIDVLQGNGTTQSIKSYTTIDRNPLKSVSHYRLRQTDYDGNFEFSKIQTINNLPTNQPVIYPNPTQNTVNIEFHESGNMGFHKLKLINSIGKTLINTTTEDSAFSISLDQYPKGIYFLILDGKTTYSVVKE